MATKNTSEVKTASVLAFERKLDPSDAVFFAGLWADRSNAKGWPAVPVREKSVRGTISNRLKTKDRDPAKLDASIQAPNLQTVDVAAMPEAPQPEQDESRWSRMVDSVRGWFGADAEPERAPPVTLPAVKVNCRVVPIEREFQRPIAYDVDYIYKGVKYRSRLAEDPGNRLRIRVSVVPYVVPTLPAASTP